MDLTTLVGGIAIGIVLWMALTDAPHKSQPPETVTDEVERDESEDETAWWRHLI